MERRWIIIENIHIADNRRAVDMDKVRQIAESILEVGLMYPPAVCLRGDIVLKDGEVSDNAAVLIYGRHRLEALKLNGETHVECDVYDVDDRGARLLEIAENLHRADLTKLERDEQVDEWRRLTEGDLQSRQPDAIESKRGDGRGHRPESGVSAAARALGMSEPDVRRAKKVAAIKPEAKTAIRSAGLDDNRTAMLAVAKEPTPEAQLAKVAEIVAAKAAPRIVETISEDERYKIARASYDALTPERQERLLREIIAELDQIPDYVPRFLRA